MTDPNAHAKQPASGTAVQSDDAIKALTPEKMLEGFRALGRTTLKTSSSSLAMPST